jgi:hypothetical protein
MPVFDLSTLSHEQRLELSGLIDELERRRRTRLIETMFPDTGPLRRELYPRHLEFSCRARSTSSVSSWPATGSGRPLRPGPS